MPINRSSRRLWQAVIGLAALVGTAYSAPPAPAQVGAPPTPAGTARFWFYREFFPGDSGDMPAISMNGALIGYGLSGTNFYRDVAPGQYHLTVETVGQDVGQSKDVAVTQGETVYVKIGSLPSWAESGGNRSSYQRGTYYVMIMPPQMAALEMPQTRQSGGN